MAEKEQKMDFDALVSAIRQVHERLAAQAGRAVNINLTMRNWLIGAYIAEYELRGEDRAAYGDNLFGELAELLPGLRVSNSNRRQLYDYLKFYRAYPQIVGTVSALLALPPEKLLNSLFVSKYQLELPSKEDMQRFLEENIRETDKS